MKLLLEFTEFNNRKMNSDSVPQSTHVNNPHLSLGSLNKHEINLRSSLSKLNDLYKDISKSTTGVNIKDGNKIEGKDIKNIKIQRIYPKDDIYLNVYFTFELYEKEYYGYINKINSENPILHSELFRDTSVFGSKEWAIRIKGNLIKVIKLWLNVKSGKYLSLKEIDMSHKNTGHSFLLPPKTQIILKSSNNDHMLISYENEDYYLRGKNYYYFNYYFTEVKD